MPYKGEGPSLMTMAISLSDEMLTFLRASTNPCEMIQGNIGMWIRYRDVDSVPDTFEGIST